jgi:hypothetical protein
MGRPPLVIGDELGTGLGLPPPGILIGQSAQFALHALKDALRFAALPS